MQVVLGTIVVAIILFDNVAAGFILGVAVLLMFMRVHMKKYGIKLDMWSLKPQGKYPMKSLVNPYVTPEHLEDAQNNVFDEPNMAKEMKGIQGVYGEPVYGAQGTDNTMPGLDVLPPGATFVAK